MTVSIARGSLRNKVLAAGAACALALPLLATENPAGAAPSASPVFAPPPPAVVSSSTRQPGGHGYQATLYNFTVHTGPGRSTACNIVGELFVAQTASAKAPVPVILTTNGFGGSYKDQVALAEYFAPRGYAVLTYSGLGFGGSGCNIELDSPTWDGEAASQLISWLGNQPEILRDGRDDPRLGMIGGSYGGGIQFSTASIDARVDAIVPVITWNDLAYSLAPENNAPNFRFADTTPGVLKWQWTSLFFGDGMSEPLQHATTTPVPPSTCPGFDPAVCQEYLQSSALGYPSASVIATLRSDSMVRFYEHVHAPALLMQGEADTLFNIDEAVANYYELKSQGVPVKLVLQSWGHSNSTPAAGELSYISTLHGYETLLVQDWFGKYLKHQNISTGPAVEYFRPWVSYNKNGSAEPAYGTSGGWPVGGVTNFYLSGNGALVTTSAGTTAGTLSFVRAAGSEPASYSETSGVQYMSPFSSIPPTDPPNTFAAFETQPLAAGIDSVGIPVVTFTLKVNLASSANPATEPTLVGKIYDVSPSGTATLVERLVSPVRVTGSGNVTMTLPGVVHRYAAGDRIELVIAATDQAYLGCRVADALSITVDPLHPSVLSLPSVPVSQEQSGGGRATGG
jgi:predicted acyl esterase